MPRQDEMCCSSCSRAGLSKRGVSSHGKPFTFKLKLNKIQNSVSQRGRFKCAGGDMRVAATVSDREDAGFPPAPMAACVGEFCPASYGIGLEPYST